MHNNLFCFWTGSNVMPESRIKALHSLKNSHLNVQFITCDNLNEWILKDYPLHQAYEYLSFVHKADYLRVYFMHHYGGAYSDIKNIHSSWLNSWELLVNSDKFGIGYREIGCKGVAMIPSLYYFFMLINYRRLLGNGAYIFKPNTLFTSEWYKLTNIILDKKLVQLKINPSRHPEDYRGRMVNGLKSKYPLSWSELLGNVFHPLCIKYSDNLLYNLPTPDLYSDYDI